jgi:hypothetical protein
MSFLSLIRGLQLIKAEQKQQGGTALINVTDAVDTLKLVFFSGIKSRQGIVLMWMTHSRNALYGYEIERKNSKGQFTSIAQIKEAKPGQICQFIDQEFTLDSEYRLKQANPFLGENYSKVVVAGQC